MGSRLHRSRAFWGQMGCFQPWAEQEGTRAPERTSLFEKEKTVEEDATLGL